jgi:hypothetical protein
MIMPARLADTAASPTTLTGTVSPEQRDAQGDAGHRLSDLLGRWRHHKLVEVSRGAQINRLCLAYPPGLGGIVQARTRPTRRARCPSDRRAGYTRGTYHPAMGGTLIVQG